MESCVYIKDKGFRPISEKDNDVLERLSKIMMYEYDIFLDDTLWPMAIDVNITGNVTVLRMSQLQLDAPLPEQVTEFKALKELDLSHSCLRTIPPSIGLLKELEVLHLRNNKIRNLPREIGNLQSLHKLDVCNNPIRSLPCAIGRLKKLERLDMGGTFIRSLPNEFYELLSLEWWNTSVVSIAPSVERLQSLEFFSVKTSKNTAVEINLPTEFGNLPNLKEVHLVGFSEIHLPLATTATRYNNLDKLTRLDLTPTTADFDVQCIDFVRRLPNLKSLALRLNAKKLEPKESQFLLDIVRTTPRLGFFQTNNTGLVLETHIPGLGYALACNRFYDRTNRRNPFAVVPAVQEGDPEKETGEQQPQQQQQQQEEQQQLNKKLWPLILSKATDFFGPWKTSRHQQNTFPIMDAHDAVYKLLLDGRESFLYLLRDQNCESVL